MILPDIKWNHYWQKHAKKKLANESVYGDRWGNPHRDHRLKAIVDQFIIPFVNPEHTALEIGPGGGRWTQFLLSFKRIYAIDLNRVMFKHLRRNFPDADHIQFILTSGTDFPNVPANSVDFAFTYGTFVHMEPLYIYKYLSNLRTVLKRGAHIVAQYSDKDKKGGQKRKMHAHNNPELMKAIVNDLGFKVISEETESLPNASVMLCEWKPTS